MRSSVVQAIQHVKIADEFMSDFVRSAPNTRGAVIFKDYSRRLQWILRDIITYPYFDDEVRKGIKVEIESDAFAVPAIVELGTQDSLTLLKSIIDNEEYDVNEILKMVNKIL